MDPRATHRRLRACGAWLVLALAALAPQAAAQERAPPPFTYAGTLEQGSERYAVLTTRDPLVLLVRAGETINHQYRVQSIAGERLLLLDLASGRVQELALALPGSSGAQEPVLDTPASSSEPPVAGARPGYAH